MKKNRVWLLVVFLVIGVLLGSVISELTRGAKYFEWLSIGRSFGVSTDQPLFLDLGMIQFKFGLMIHLTVAGVLGILIAILCYRRLK